MELINPPKSKFIHVMCKKCKNKQVIFSKASTVVKCLVCGEVLAEPSGGDAIIKGKVLEVFG
jgi:small subunit ribosomal protein S27e